MKKLVAIVLAAVLCLSCAAALADNMIVHITAVCYDENHVGLNWAGAYSIGGMEITDGQVIDLYPQTYEVTATLGEYDRSPDIGTETNSFKVTANRLNNGFTVQQRVVVSENKGYYKDYWCEWYIYYDFSPVGNAIVLH